MFVPIPIIIGVGLIFLLMLGQIVRSSRRHDPLLGRQPPASRPTSAPLRDAPPIMPSATLPPEVEAQVRTLIATGRTIEAIKLTRNATHLGLKESKELVEALD